LAAGAAGSTLPVHWVASGVHPLSSQTTKAFDRICIVAFILVLVSIAILAERGMSYPAFVWHIETVMGHGRRSSQ